VFLGAVACTSTPASPLKAPGAKAPEIEASRTGEPLLSASVPLPAATGAPQPHAERYDHRDDQIAEHVGSEAASSARPPAAVEPPVESERRANSHEATATRVVSTTSANERTGPPSEVGSCNADVVSVAHVLVQFKGAMPAGRTAATPTRSRSNALAIITAVRDQAREGRKFAELAAEFSDEPGAAGRGGNLGRIKRNALVPPIDAVAHSLCVGQISDIVETKFGFHVVLRYY